jgi:hypothetical protein
MGAPAYELVGVATARLRTYAPLTALIGANKVLLRPVETDKPPYVAMGEAVTRRGDATELRSTTIDMTIHAYADTPNALQDVRNIAGAIADALHDFPLTLPTKRLVTLEHRGERVFYDADGVTGHAVVDFTAIIETP